MWTMTIFEKDKKADLPLATFPIAIGPKSAKHDEVETIVAEDLKRMMNERIDAFLGHWGNVQPEPVTFSAQMFLTLGDQPERRGGNSLMAGNSKSHPRWRYCCDISKIRPVFPACNHSVFRQ